MKKQKLGHSINWHSPGLGEKRRLIHPRSIRALIENDGKDITFPSISISISYDVVSKVGTRSHLLAQYLVWARTTSCSPKISRTTYSKQRQGYQSLTTLCQECVRHFIYCHSTRFGQGRRLVHPRSIRQLI